MPEVVMLCGIPTSGKSTYVEKLKKLSYWKDAVILSTDNYIEKYAESVGKTYNEVFDDVISDATCQLETDLIIAKDKGRDIIWDQTNLSIKTRKKKLSGFPHYYHKGAVYFKISLEDALERNNHREGKFIPESIIKRMHHQFEIPTKQEGFGWIEAVQSSNWHNVH